MKNNEAWVMVPLGRSGKFALVDAADAERVTSYRWHLCVGADHRGTYVRAKRRKGPNGAYLKAQLLHRFILDAPPGSVVDHISRDTLDNRRSNLRFCSPLENRRNGRNANPTGFKGIQFDPRRKTKPWGARINAGEPVSGGRHQAIFLGRFSTAEEAARAYDAAAVEHFGAFANLNFPPEPAPAPELPRKVEPGTTLTIGALYRITEIAEWEKDPRDRVGKEFLCDSSDHWSTTYEQPAWLVADGTYVTGLELVADAPKETK